MDRELSARDRRNDRLRRWVRPGSVLLGLVLLGLWLSGWIAPGVERDRLRIATVERGALESVLSARGVVQPASERILTSPVAGRLLRVLRYPGSRVEPGDALLELDLSEAELALAQLRGRLEQSRAGRLEARSELDNAAGRLESNRRIKKLELEEARFRLEQDRQLFAAGLASEAALRQSQTRAERLEIEVQSLDAEIESSADTARARLARLDAELASLEGELRQRRAELERASTRVQAPGVVTWVLDEEGAGVGPGDLLARLADLGTYRVEASSSDVHAERLRPGLPVRVQVPGSADDQALPGRVSRILPAVEDGVLGFWVELDADARAMERLRPNQRLDVQVISDRLDDALQVEKGPFARGPGEQEVFVLAPDGRTAHRRTVELGLSGHRHWQAVRGLAAGERVIVSDLERFRHVDELRLR